MVGCWRCTYPSIRFFVSRSRSFCLVSGVVLWVVLCEVLVVCVHVVLCVVLVVVVVRTWCYARVSGHSHARMQLIKTDRPQCAGPLRLDCPAGTPLRLLPPSAGSRRSQVQKSPNPKARKKIARHAHLSPPLLRRKGGAIFSISSALSAQDLGPE